MIRFILRRMLLMVVVLLGISVMTFTLTHVVPGNPARLLAGQHATENEVQAVAKLYVTDKAFRDRSPDDRIVMEDLVISLTR